MKLAHLTSIASTRRSADRTLPQGLKASQAVLIFAPCPPLQKPRASLVWNAAPAGISTTKKHSVFIGRLGPS
jgi:hypothetical protein